MDNRKHLTMQDLEDMGFELLNSEPFFCNQAVAQTRCKGAIRIETLYWLSGEGETYQKVTIEPYLTKEQIIRLDKALNSKEK